MRLNARWVFAPLLAATTVSCDVYYDIVYSDQEIKLCELHADRALEMEGNRIKGVPRADVTDLSVLEGIMSKSYLDRELTLVDNIYNRELGRSMDEIYNNVKRNCLKGVKDIIKEEVKDALDKASR